MNARRSSVVVLGVILGVTVLGIGLHGLAASSSPQVHALLTAGHDAFARNDRGDAALFLERARFLAPRATDVRTAISSAGIVDAEAPVARALRVLTSQEWATLATGFGWLAAIAAALAIAKRTSWSARAVAFTAGLGFMLALGAVVESNVSHPAIVSSKEAPLLVAPYSAAPREATLPAGTMVVPGDAYDSFVKVHAPDGATGWVPQSSLSSIALSKT